MSQENLTSREELELLRLRKEERSGLGAIARNYQLGSGTPTDPHCYNGLDYHDQKAQESEYNPDPKPGRSLRYVNGRLTLPNEEATYTLPEKPSRCAEHWDQLPTTTDHLWKGGLRNEPVGDCLKCGESIQSYNARWIVAVKELQKGAKSQSQPLNELLEWKEWAQETMAKDRAYAETLRADVRGLNLKLSSANATIAALREIITARDNKLKEIFDCFEPDPIL